MQISSEGITHCTTLTAFTEGSEVL